MTTAVKQREADQNVQGYGTQMPFESINEPGAYICNWSGHLLRVPEDCLKPGRSPTMSIRGTEPLFVTKITNDPFVQRSKARLLASDADLPVNF